MASNGPLPASSNHNASLPTSRTGSPFGARGLNDHPHNAAGPSSLLQAHHQQRQGTGSATTTIAPTEPAEPHLVLRLRGAHEPRRRRHIQWSEDTVDNEGMGRKSSKVCCIYHPAREFGESSSEDSSSSSDESDSDPGSSGEARQSKNGGPQACGHGHSHSHKHRKGRPRRRHGEGGKDDTGRPRKASPNAYERMPHPRKQENTPK